MTRVIYKARTLVHYFLFSVLILTQFLLSARAGTYLYVAGRDSVSVINANTDKIVSTIQPSPGAFTLAASPDGKRVFVTSGSTRGDVSVIDTKTNKVIKILRLGNLAVETAFSPDGKFAYITRCAGPRDSSCVKNAISVVRMDTYAVIKTIPVPGKGWPGIAVSPNGRYLYDCNENGLFVIKASNGKIIRTFPISGGLWDVKKSPDGSRIYVYGNHIEKSGSGAQELMTIRASDNSVVNIKRLPAWFYGIDFALSHSGKLLYITYCGIQAQFCKGGYVDVYNFESHSVAHKIYIGPGSYPYGLAMSPDGKRVFAANDAEIGAVAVISTQKNAIIKKIWVGTYPSAIAIVSTKSKR